MSMPMRVVEAEFLGILQIAGIDDAVEIRELWKIFLEQFKRSYTGAQSIFLSSAGEGNEDNLKRTMITDLVVTNLGFAVQTVTRVQSFREPSANRPSIAKDLGFVFGELMAAIEFGIVARRNDDCMYFDIQKQTTVSRFVRQIIARLNQKFSVGKYTHLARHILKIADNARILQASAAQNFEGMKRQIVSIRRLLTILSRICMGENI